MPLESLDKSGLSVFFLRISLFRNIKRINVPESHDLKREVTALLERLENSFYYRVPHQRYFLYHTFERIATDMNDSFRGACYLQGIAGV